jgi:hypothetical protein
MKARVTQPNGVRQVGVAYPLRFVFHKEASSDRSRNLGHSSSPRFILRFASLPSTAMDRSSDVVRQVAKACQPLVPPSVSLKQCTLSVDHKSHASNTHSHLLIAVINGLFVCEILTSISATSA